MQMCEGVKVRLLAFLTLALDGAEWLASCLSYFTPPPPHEKKRTKNLGTHCLIGGWVSASAGLNIVAKRKILPCCELNPVVHCHFNVTNFSFFKKFNSTAEE
jgi:hypothetical protein